jgi:hypothetical protein
MKGIKRGPLTDAERSDIERLVSTLKKPTAANVARRLNRHPATVAWFMITRGLIERPVLYGRAAYTRRDGIQVTPYAPEHDRRIVELRTQGKKVRQIAEAISHEFGIIRTGHSVDVRLKMLAAYSGGPEGDVA